eukprot:gene3694-7350_t
MTAGTSSFYGVILLFVVNSPCYYPLTHLVAFSCLMTFTSLCLNGSLSSIQWIRFPSSYPRFWSCSMSGKLSCSQFLR